MAYVCCFFSLVNVIKVCLHGSSGHVWQTNKAMFTQQVPAKRVDSSSSGCGSCASRRTGRFSRVPSGGSVPNVQSSTKGAERELIWDVTP